MGTRQTDKSRSAVLIALAIGCVLYAPLAAQEASQLVGVSAEAGTDGATVVRLEVEPMTSWSSYRGADGALTLELANTRPAPDLAVPDVGDGVITGISVEEDDRGATLVKVVGGETEHEVIPTGTGLEVILRTIETTAEAAEEPTPAEDEATQAAVDTQPETVAEPQMEPQLEPQLELESQGSAEPVAAPEPEAAPEVEVAVAESGPVQSSAVQPYGTVNAPFAAEAQGELAATQVLAVDASTEGGDASVIIRGDGSFSYTAFSLDNPARFVLDLHGVLVGVSDSRVEVDQSGVEQVRLAQFQDDPQPVARVVFDLSSPDVPWVQPLADGLVVRFGSPPVADMPAAGDEIVEAAPVVEPDPALTDAALGSEAVEEVIEVAADEFTAPDAAEEMAEVVEGSMLAEPVPEPVAAATEAAYYNEQDLTVTTGDAEGEPNEVSGFEARQFEDGSQRFSGEPMDLSLQDTDVRDVLRSMAQISGLNLVIQPSVSGRVTVEFTQVPWDQALEQILKINNLGYEVEGNIMRVAPLSQLREEAEERQRLAQARAAAVPLTTVLQRISYARANDIARILAARGGIMSQRGSVVVDARTNTLIIKELPAYIDTVLSVIENLDIPEPQVMIEARIIETTKRFTRSLGIEWGFTGVADAEHGNTTGLEFPNNVQADGGVALLTGGRNGFLDLTLGNVLNTFNLDVTLQAAENEGLINILSEPRVATLNNERATIQSGLQIPIQTVANNTVSVQFVNATLRLDVTPQVTADGTVLMEIRIQKREPQPAFAVPGAANAPIATKEASTRVIVRDGGTTVIGGIYEVSTDHGEDRVPGLGKAKGIGALFRNKRRNDQNEELLIFITPKVIRL